MKEAILKLVQISGNLAICSHIEPDGDGFCASLALQYFLKELGKDSSIVVDAGDLSRFEHLMDNARLHIYQEGDVFDRLVVLDCNSFDRLGARAALAKDPEQIILIDHHVVEHQPIAARDILIDRSYASVGAILFDILETEISALPDEARIRICNCLYTTLLNDTNNFVNANTDARVFQQAARLTQMGIKPYELYERFFLNHAAYEMRYYGEVLSTIELALDGKLLILVSSLEMEARNQIDGSALMSPTRYVQGVKGLSAIAYLREDAPGHYKVSLRSKHLDVNKIATKYGGGGHKSASGCQMKGSLNEIKELVTQEIAAAVPQS